MKVKVAETAGFCFGEEWSANHVESEVCGSRPSGQYLKYSDTGLFL